MTEVKHLLVPSGLHDSRADAGLAKLMGLSRSAAAELLEQGLVSQNSKVLSKSDSLIADAMLEVAIVEKRDLLEIVPAEVPGFKIVYQDEDIIVVDKPAGVASHPSVN